MSNISRALLIGINYNGTRNQLRGCYNDAIDMANFIETQYGVNDIMILTDEMPQYNLPTKKHIIQAINWLVNGAKKGDCLFFHYSGHGSQVKTTDIHEDDYMDETICPIDYDESGMICDGELRYYLVDPLPAGCKLTCVLDCCHSGTGLDLKYNLEYDETNNHVPINDKNLLQPLSQKLNKLNEYYLKDNGYKDSNSDVIMISGCMSTQTSSDAVIGNKNCGAMTSAFLETLQNNKQLDYISLMNTMLTILQKRDFEQKPQFHFSKNIDIKDIFKPNEPTKYSFVSLGHEMPREVELINHEFQEKKNKTQKVSQTKYQTVTKPNVIYQTQTKPQNNNQVATKPYEYVQYYKPTEYLQDNYIPNENEPQHYYYYKNVQRRQSYDQQPIYRGQSYELQRPIQRRQSYANMERKYSVELQNNKEKVYYKKIINGDPMQIHKTPLRYLE